MKKLALLAPILVISLFGCGNKTHIDLPTKIVATNSDGESYETLLTYNNYWNLIKTVINNYDATGAIKDCQTYTYTYDENIHDKILYLDFVAVSGEQIHNQSKSTYTYDEKNNLKEMMVVGTNDSGEYKNKETYGYNELNQLTSLDCYYFEDNEFKIDNQTTYEYNEYGDVAKKTYTNPNVGNVDGVTTYTYDEHRCCVHEETKYTEGDRDPTIIDTTYYENNPNKPLHIHEELGIDPYEVDSDYCYDKQARLKYMDMIYKNGFKIHEDYYYD